MSRTKLRTDSDSSQVPRAGFGFSLAERRIATQPGMRLFAFVVRTVITRKRPVSQVVVVAAASARDGRCPSSGNLQSFARVDPLT